MIKPGGAAIIGALLFILGGIAGTTVQKALTPAAPEAPKCMPSVFDDAICTEGNVPEATLGENKLVTVKFVLPNNNWYAITDAPSNLSKVHVGSVVKVCAVPNK